MTIAGLPAARNLALDAGIADRLIALARDALPAEACALLSGPDATRATRVHPARNALASRYRYDLHPEDLVRIVTAVEAAGEAIVAIFHSHPDGPATLSASDVRESRWDVVQLVAGLAPGGGVELRAWRIADGEALEVQLRA